MRIRIEELEQGPLRVDFEQPPEVFPVLAEMAGTDGCQFRAPVRAALRAQLIGDIVEIAGDIATTVRLNCGRCLKSFETPIESSFALTYSQKEPAPDQRGAQQEDLELAAEDMGLICFQGEEIDLKNELQEQVVLAFPLRALCSQNCKGLCPKCGADLNTATCDCDRSPSDGKFDVLKHLRLKPPPEVG